MLEPRTTTLANARRVLLLRQGLVFADPGAGRSPDRRLLEAVELELGELGYAASTRLRDRLASLSATELTEVQLWASRTLAASLGADRRHEPLFRRFPDDVPTDTHALWVRKVVSHFLQAEDQPCLFCRRVGTTHVLSCMHVVCDHCFDGTTYSACPVCQHHVDRSSPFFKPSGADHRLLPNERVRFKLLDLGGDLAARSEAYFRALVDRQQPLSPSDVDDLKALVADFGDRVLNWLPTPVPVRETTATVLAAVIQAGGHLPLPAARTHLRTATDVLRFIAAYSGAEPSLQGEQRKSHVPPNQVKVQTVYRFRVARLPRSLRKTLLALLDAMPESSLLEDIQRHAAYWVWVGQFLHPGEYAERFPVAARAFELVRKRRPDGTPAPRHRGFASRVEAALREGGAGLTETLAERPGELARRLDHALRVLAGAPQATDQLLATFRAERPAMATPVLLTLAAHLPTRGERAPIRIYWPKGAVARAVTGPDTREPLDARTREAFVSAIEDELLRRFAEKPAVEAALIDEALRRVPVPFNERTAARSAISLPRGASVPVPMDAHMRLFLHWCQPPGTRQSTDLDLSVAFYAGDWTYQGVCSFYQLTATQNGEAIANSSGDLQDAPFPDGATEFVDVDLEVARRSGIRYAVAVVTAYAGLPFDALERAFAGLMFRKDVFGAHFDPRTVALKFALSGQHGVFLPLVVDLEAGRLHWLDMYARGDFQFNQVEASKEAISTIGPRMIGYFASGVRPSMYDLALLHAASRAERVWLRGNGLRCIARDGASPRVFLDRLRHEAGVASGLPDAPGPLFAALLEGDVALPAASDRYVLFPGVTTGTMAAADLLS
jgi:hypothetical protein